VALPDGTYGYRVVRPEWEKILTALRRGECNALMVPDIDRAMRDPLTLEDLIDVVEYYGVYVASLTGNISPRQQWLRDEEDDASLANREL
jgi:DNA invertase Pin-like site-specific DNA recombinase